MQFVMHPFTLLPFCCITRLLSVYIDKIMVAGYKFTANNLFLCNILPIRRNYLHPNK